MSQGPIAQETARIIARLAKMDEAEVDPRRWVTDYGIDSFSLLVVRESVEQAFRVRIPDERWLQFESVAELIAYVETESGSAKGGSREIEAAPPEAAVEPRGLSPDGILHDQIEIGMPFTGLVNLAENPLLKYLGDLRWAHASRICGVPSRSIVNEQGDRLYPTFFYVEMAFPENRPMAAYGENDRLCTVSTLQRYGGSMLDGITYILRDGEQAPPGLACRSVAEAVAAGIPAVRMSNIFVMQFDGAEWLKKSRPSNPGFDRIREAAVPPDSYVLVKKAEENGRFDPPGKTYVPMVDEPARVRYDLVPDRDLNGAGLVYFANYPLFLDVCEREVLSRARLGLTSELIDRRTIVRRRSAYLGNASARDSITVEVDPRLHDPRADGHPAPEMAPIRLLINYRMTRNSDGRVMMVSTAEKVIFGRHVAEAPFADELLGTSLAGAS